MYFVAYDAERRLAVHYHPEGPLTDADVDVAVAAIERSAADAETAKSTAATLILVHSKHGPDAKQRQRIGTAAAKIAKGFEVMVTASMLTRAMMTAIRWLAQREGMTSATYATYPEGRDWLAARSGHPAEAIDALHRSVTEQAKGERPSRRPLSG